MSKRHAFRPGDWESVARRLDEIISAQTGEDPFWEARTLLVAKLAHEAHGAPDATFLSASTSVVSQMQDLLQQARARWPGVLEDTVTSRLRNADLARCATLLQSVHLLADDWLGLDAIFEFIVSRAAKGQKGQFFTPRHVIAEIVEMLQPRPGEWVVDPACGSGGFLHHALRHSPGCQVAGFDTDARAVQVARIVIAAAGHDPTCIQRLDSLRRPSGDDADVQTIESHMRGRASDFAGFDVVLTNPPFAGDVGQTYAAQYELAQTRRVERDVLFAERCLGLLRPGGRLAIVLPHNKFSSAAWTFLRRFLLQRLQDVAVISLARSTFQPHTGQKACVLIGRKRLQMDRAPTPQQVLFFISERSGKDDRGRLQQVAADGQAGSAPRPIDHDLGQATPLVQQHLHAGLGA